MKKVLGFAAICLIWGTTFLAIKIGLQDLPPLLAVGLRFLAAGLVLGCYLLIVRGRIVFATDKGNLKLMLYLTFMSYLVPYALVYWGEQFISSGLTSVIFAMLPLNVVVISTVFFRDTVSLWDVGGVALGLAGCVMIFSESVFAPSGFHLYGMIAVYLCSLSHAGMAIVLKKTKVPYDPLKINLAPFLAAGALITALSLVVERGRDVRLTLSAGLSVLYLSIFGTVVAFAVYYWLIPRLKLSLLSTYTYILPIVAIFAGRIVLQEKLSALQIGGTGLVLAGISMTTKNRK